MSSAVPTSSAPGARRLRVLGATLFANIVGQVQQFDDLGRTPAEFAADSDATPRVVGWAFAIRGPIYLGLPVYAIRQALLGIGLWVIAAAMDAELATIVLLARC